MSRKKKTTKRNKRYQGRKKTQTSSKVGVIHGFRSGLEDLNASTLIEYKEQVNYEAHTLEYIQPSKLRKYTPDFILRNGIVVETKGRFLTADRQKHLMIKATHPGLDLRFVFANPHQTISKRSKTTYAKWCDSKGFKWASETIPQKWCKEPRTKGRTEAARKALGWEPT